MIMVMTFVRMGGDKYLKLITENLLRPFHADAVSFAFRKFTCLEGLYVMVQPHTFFSAENLIFHKKRLLPKSLTAEMFKTLLHFLICDMRIS